MLQLTDWNSRKFLLVFNGFEIDDCFDYICRSES